MICSTVTPMSSIVVHFRFPPSLSTLWVLASLLVWYLMAVWNVIKALSLNYVQRYTIVFPSLHLHSPYFQGFPAWLLHWLIHKYVCSFSGASLLQWKLVQWGKYPPGSWVGRTGGRLVMPKSKQIHHFMNKTEIHWSRAFPDVIIFQTIFNSSSLADGQQRWRSC